MATLKPARRHSAAMQTAVRVAVDAPIHQAWTKLADLGALAKWAPDVASSRSDKLRLGARRVAVLKAPAYGKAELVETVKVLEPHGFTYDIEGGIGPLEAIETTWRLEPKGDRCVVVVSSTVQLARRLRPVALLAKLSWRRQLKALAKGFKRYAEQG